MAATFLLTSMKRAAAKTLTAQERAVVLDHISANLGHADMTVAALAGVVGMSEFHFARLFKQTLNESPHQYILRQRIELVKMLLARDDRTLAEIAVEVGFMDHSHLTHVFKRSVGVTPSEFRKQVRKEMQGDVFWSVLDALSSGMESNS